MRKRKALKGGYKYNNPAMAGPLLKENLNTTNDDDIKALERSYDQKYKTVENNLKQLMKLKTEANDNYHKKEIEKLKDKKIEDKASEVSNKQGKESINMFANGFSAICRASFAIGKYFTSIFKFIITTISNAGQGAIIKCIITIVFIILIIVGFTIGFSGLKNKKNEITNKSTNYEENLLNLENDDYLNIHKSNDIFTIITDYFYGKIPDSYKYKFNSFSNSISYITTGKNQYEDYLERREEIENGRSDNIFHINFKNNPSSSSPSIYSKDNTMSIIKPKDVILEFNENLYYDSDYNKIDSNIKVVSNYPQKCVINMIHNSKGKYALDLDNIKYYNNNNNYIIDDSKLIRPIFIKDTNDVVKLNSFNNSIKISVKSIISSALSSTSSKSSKSDLIADNAKKYLDDINKFEYEIKGQYSTTFTSLVKNRIDTRIARILYKDNYYNIYHDSANNYIFKNDNDGNTDKSSYSNDFFDSNITIFIDKIYDQSGNDNHLIFNNTTNNNRPRLTRNTNKNILSYYFENNNILTFKKKIKDIDIMFIKTSIGFDFTTMDPKNINTMKFLSSSDSGSVIDIRGVNNTSLVFHTDKYTINEGNQISKHYKITSTDEKNYIQRVTTSTIYDKNKIILENLGDVNNGFTGFLYELEIYVI